MNSYDENWLDTNKEISVRQLITPVKIEINKYNFNVKFYTLYDCYENLTLHLELQVQLLLIS